MIPYLNEINGVLTCVANTRSYSVYFLRSLSSNKTYVGFSTNPFNRILQHNGYKEGGAKRTSKDGPWEIVCIVSGFPTARAALQFEFKWHDIRAQRKRIKNGPDGKRRYRKCPHIIGCQDGLEHLLNCKWTETSPEPRSFPLTIIWNVNEDILMYKWDCKKYDYGCWSIYQGNINYNKLIEQVTQTKIY